MPSRQQGHATLSRQRADFCGSFHSGTCDVTLTLFTPGVLLLCTSASWGQEAALLKWTLPSVEEVNLGSSEGHLGWKYPIKCIQTLFVKIIQGVFYILKWHFQGWSKIFKKMFRNFQILREKEYIYTKQEHYTICVTLCPGPIWSSSSICSLINCSDPTPAWQPLHTGHSRRAEGELRAQCFYVWLYSNNKQSGNTSPPTNERKK